MKNKLARHTGWNTSGVILTRFEPTVFTLNKGDTGVYIHCPFDGEGNPDWEYIITVCQDQIEAQKAQGG